MRTARVYVQDRFAGSLTERDDGTFTFEYEREYKGPPVSLTMPISKKAYAYDTFPPFFEGLLPEGMQLDSLLRREKIDRSDLFSQLLVVGLDLVGDVTVKTVGDQP